MEYNTDNFHDPPYKDYKSPLERPYYDYIHLEKYRRKLPTKDRINSDNLAQSILSESEKMDTRVKLDLKINNLKIRNPPKFLTGINDIQEISGKQRKILGKRFQCPVGTLGTAIFTAENSFKIGKISRGLYKGSKLKADQIADQFGKKGHLFPGADDPCNRKGDNDLFEHYDLFDEELPSAVRSFFLVFNKEKEYKGSKKDLIKVRQTDGISVKDVFYLFCGIAIHPEQKGNNGYIPCVPLK